MKKTLIIGASTNKQRYSHIAFLRLAEHSIETIPFGIKVGEINGVQIENEWKAWKDIHTVTLYINPSLQEEYYDKVRALKVKRVIFNPGTENPQFEKLLEDDHIEVVLACTLVLLSIDKY